MSAFHLTPNEQFFSSIMARASYISSIMARASYISYIMARALALAMIELKNCSFGVK
jgi:hypothetical protein